jgi:ATP sulfurylase
MQPPTQLPTHPPHSENSIAISHPSTPPLLQDLAVFTVESKWRPNKPLEALNCYATTSIEHPAVQVGRRAALCVCLGHTDGCLPAVCS